MEKTDQSPNKAFRVWGHIYIYIYVSIYMYIYIYIYLFIFFKEFMIKDSDYRGILKCGVFRLTPLFRKPRISQVLMKPCCLNPYL